MLALLTYQAPPNTVNTTGLGQTDMAEPAHVYAADQGLHLENETVEALLYDDATYLALVIKARWA
jgi:hypothetical protein